MRHKPESVPLTRRELLKYIGATAGSLVLSSGRRTVALPRALTGNSSSAPANIILIIVDATRSDHISAYGSPRPTTPNLDAWFAGQGARFHDATSTSVWTYPGNAGTLTGRGPTAAGAISWYSPGLPADVPLISDYLSAAGYYTAGFVTAKQIRANRGFGRGYDVYDDSLTYGHTTASRGVAGELHNLATTWLDTWTPNSQPLFLLLYYFDPHTWYYAPAPYDTLYDPAYAGPLTAEVYADAQEVVAGNIIPTPRDIQHLEAIYDGEITYWDYYLGQMMTSLQNRGLLDNSLVILTADHGDNFGEHNHWNHGQGIYHELLRVPLLMRYPGVIPNGHVATSPVQNLDVIPTILDWLNVPVPGDIQGVSLRALAEGQTTAPSRDLFAELNGLTDPTHWSYWITPPYDLRTVHRDGWKYIHHVRHSELDELYQLNPTSQYETDNVIAANPTRADQMLEAILDWFNLPAAEALLPAVLRA